MDLRYLRAFVAVADHGGISAAAQQLGYAQASVSAQLKRLESDLGATVLRRASTGAVLTDAGRRLLPHAREALALDERMRRAVHGERPRLRIGAQESLAHAWLPDVLAAFEYGAGGPDGNAEVELTVGNRAKLDRMFTAGELDVVFQYDNGVRSLSPSRVVGHDRTVLAAAASHPLARLRTVPVDQLLRYEFLVAEPGCTAEMLVDRFGRDLLGEARSGMVTGSLGALIRLTAHGRGITLLPEQAVARELASGELVELELAEAVRPVSIMARWWHPRQGMAERPLRALLELAHRADPYPAATAAATTSAAGQAS